MNNPKGMCMHSLFISHRSTDINSDFVDNQVGKLGILISSMFHNNEYALSQNLNKKNHQKPR